MGEGEGVEGRGSTCMYKCIDVHDMRVYFVSVYARCVCVCVSVHIACFPV